MKTENAESREDRKPNDLVVKAKNAEHREVRKPNDLVVKAKNAEHREVRKPWRNQRKLSTLGHS